MESLRCLALAVKKQKAEDIRRRLVSMGLLKEGLRVFSNDLFVYFPIDRELDVKDFPELESGDAFIKELEFEVIEERPRSLRDALRGTLDDSLLQYVPRSFDIIGDVAVIELEDVLKPYAKEIAMALKRVHKNVDTVLLKAGPFSGEYRIRDYEVLAGSGKTLTMHKEHGCVYVLDVKDVFFTPRLSGERFRVASQVKEGEIVVDMFAGVGPFSILIAKLQPKSKIYAFEINPSAYKFLVRNVELNLVKDRVVPVFGDVRYASIGMDSISDRLIMNLPFSSIEFLDVAVRLAKIEGAVIHIYVASRDDEGAVAERTINILKALGCDVEIMFLKELKEVAPRTSVFAIDLFIKKHLKG